MRDKEGVWTSPLIIDVPGKTPLVVLQSKKSFDVLNIKTGERVYKTEGEVSSISSPAAKNGKLFVPINGTTAYAVTGDGSLVEEWNSAQIRPSSMSCVVDGEKIYALSRSGVLASYSTTDGTEQNKIRVISGSSAWATPVIADQHMYLFAQAGQSYVVKLTPGEDPKVVHSHTFEDEVFLGSPAVADNAMYVRSDKFLWKIASEN
jgi:hypothetical protein